MAAKTPKFGQDAQKYVGRMGIMEGPPGGQRLVVQQPITQRDRIRPKGAEGTDLRPERQDKQKSPPKGIKKVNLSGN